MKDEPEPTGKPDKKKKEVVAKRIRSINTRAMVKFRKDV
jgi:hypothetical protein